MVYRSVSNKDRNTECGEASYESRQIWPANHFQACRRAREKHLFVCFQRYDSAFCILTQLQNGLKSIMWIEYLHIDTKTTVDIVRAWKSGVKIV